MVRVPKGYDVGFQPHNFERLTAGRNTDVDQLLFNKFVNAEPKLASLLIENVLQNPRAVMMLNGAMKSMVDTVATEKMARGQMKNVGIIPAKVIDKLTALEKAPQSAVIAVRDEDVLHALRDTKQTKGINLPIEFWEQLPEKLRNPKAILLQAKEQQRNKNAGDVLLFIYETEKGKVAIKMDYEVKVKDELSGKKLAQKLNVVRTASAVEDFTQLGAFEVLWGSLQ